MKNVEPAAVVVNDVHLSLQTLPVGLSVLAQALNYCQANGVNHLVLNGDVFTERKGQPQEVLLALMQFKAHCIRAGVRVLATAGNHDKTDLESENSFLDLYHEEGYFDVYRESGSIVIKVGGESVRLFLLPYFLESGSLGGRIEKLVKQCCAAKDQDDKDFDLGVPIPANVLCLHAAVSGVRNNDGSTVKNSITPELFGCFETVIVGHYHNYSHVGKNIFYTGSAYPRNWGEDNDKGFTVVYSDGSIKRVTATFPRYLKFEFAPQELSKADVADLSTAVDRGDQVRLLIRGTRAELKGYDLAPLLARGFDAKKKPLELDEAIEAAAENRVESHTKGTLLEQFEQFATASAYSEEIRLEGRTLLTSLK